MRLVFAASAAALIVTAATLSPASAGMYVTSITAAFPDPNGKLPAFDAVSGEGEQSWSNGFAQGVLVHGNYYNYCVSLASGAGAGTATVRYSITRGTKVIQDATIITNKDFKVVSDGIWYYCSGYYQLPDSPGAANLNGVVAFLPKGAKKAVVSSTTAHILLK